MFFPTESFIQVNSNTFIGFILRHWFINKKIRLQEFLSLILWCFIFWHDLVTLFRWCINFFFIRIHRLIDIFYRLIAIFYFLVAKLRTSLAIKFNNWESALAFMKFRHILMTGTGASYDFSLHVFIITLFNSNRIYLRWFIVSNIFLINV